MSEADNSFARFNSIDEHDDFDDTEDDMFPDSLVDIDDLFEETDTKVRQALDVDVKTALKKMSRISQSIENIRNTFSGKKGRKENSIKKRAKSMTVIV